MSSNIFENKVYYDSNGSYIASNTAVLNPLKKWIIDTENPGYNETELIEYLNDSDFYSAKIDGYLIEYIEVKPKQKIRYLISANLIGGKSETIEDIFPWSDNNDWKQSGNGEPGTWKDVTSEYEGLPTTGRRSV